MHKILIINPGPKYNPIEDFKARLESLSEFFSGTLVTSSPEELDINIKAFRLVALKIKDRNNVIRNIVYLISILQFLVKQKLSGQKYELIITYDPIKTGLIGVLAKFLFNAKLAPEVNGDYGDIENYADTQNTFMRQCKHKIYCLIIKFVLHFSDGVKLLFPTQIDYFTKKKNYKAKIEAIPSYVDINRFNNIEDKDEILFVGYPMYRKGLDILIAAFKEVAPKYPDWKMKILGWYPNQEELNKYIGECQQIYHHQAVNSKEMPTHIGQCGIFVLPSRSEAMGRVLVEAMASGKPRIGSAVGGIPTVINDGVDGLLFESENINQLAKKLDLLMSDKALRIEFATNGLKRAKAEFAIPAVNKQFIKFYQELCQL